MKKVQKIAARLFYLLVLTFAGFMYSQAQGVTGIVNICTPVTYTNKCCALVTVVNSSGFSPGDRVFLIQMRGAAANESLASPSTYGSVSDYRGAGQCELGIIASISGNNIYLTRNLYNNYNINGAVQLVKVRTGSGMIVTGTATCHPWDGNCGGVVIIESSSSIFLSGNINVDGRGFRGGKVWPSLMNGAAIRCNTSMFKCTPDSNYAGTKGEGIVADYNWGTLPDGIGCGSAAYANGGGGGNDHNAGGGGGANGGAGGRGGKEYNGCATALSNGGQGGYNLVSSPPMSLYLGGGGGSGHINNNNGASSGNGGGMVILLCNTLVFSGGSISARGISPANSRNDGGSGGGAGGTLYVKANIVAGSVNYNLSGGNGGSTRERWYGYGPGGGGGGGVYICSPALSSAFNLPSTASNPGIDSLFASSRSATGGVPLFNKPFFNIPEGYVMTCCPDPSPINITECQDKNIKLTAPYHPQALPYKIFGIKLQDDSVKIIPARTGIYTMKTILLDRCVCTNTYNVTAIQPNVHYHSDTITCGDSINLDNYITCSQYTYGWGIDSTLMLLSSKVKPNVTTTYNRKAFTDNSYECVDCIDEVTIVVKPVPTDTITVHACLNESITLYADTSCGAPTYRWQSPTGPVMIFPGIYYPLNYLHINATTGTYVVRGTLPGGCECIRVINVIADKKITYSLYAACLNEPLTLTPSPVCGPGVSYSWTTPSGPLTGYSQPYLNILANNAVGYSVNTVMPNGCICQTIFSINVNVPVRDTVVLNRHCGDIVNLDDFKHCNGYTTGWVDLANNSALLNSIITVTGSKVYELQSFRDPSWTCLNCITTVILNDIPVRDTVNKTGCVGQPIVLSPSPCGMPSGVIWYYPNGSSLAFSGNQSITAIVGNTAQTYIAESHLPNGCICTRVYNISVLQPVVYNKTITVNCGDPVNLEDHAGGCGGSYYQWFDASNSPISPNITPTHDVQYTRKEYTDVTRTCVKCITNLTINIVQPATQYKTYTATCNQDGINIGPDCNGTEYMWFDHSHHPMSNTSKFIVVPNPTVTTTYTVHAKLPNGCWCITEITINPNTNVTQFYNAVITINCGDQIDLADYDSCNSTSNWTEAGNYQPVTNTVMRLTETKTFFKTLVDANQCVNCMTTLTVHVIQPVPEVKHDTVNAYVICHGETVDPPHLCTPPANFTYKWYTKNDLTGALMFDNTPFTGQPGIDGYYHRFIYDENGCLLCIEGYLISSYAPISPAEEAAIQPVSVSICNDLHFCQDIVIPITLPDIPATQCTWTPNVIEINQSTIKFCPPYIDGQIFTKRCYSTEGCLLYVAKVQTFICEHKPGRNTAPDGNEQQGSSSGQQQDMNIQAYPNPFGNELNVTFSLLASSPVFIKMTDVTGRVVYQAEKQLYETGMHKVVINTTSFSPGMYTLLVSTAQGVYSHKLVRVK